MRVPTDEALLPEIGDEEREGDDRSSKRDPSDQVSPRVVEPAVPALHIFNRQRLAQGRPHPLRKVVQGPVAPFTPREDPGRDGGQGPDAGMEVLVPEAPHYRS